MRHFTGAVNFRILVSGMIFFSVLFSGESRAAALAVTAVNPASGPTAGGTLVSVSGAGFSAGVTSVTLATYPCSAPVVVSDTLLTCTTPENVASIADLVVNGTAGQSSTLPQSFTYQGTPTFQLLQDRVFSRNYLNPMTGAVTVLQCALCHSGAAPAGKLDTSVYSEVVGTVKPGSPSASSLYLFVLNNGMPTAQAPLSPEQKQAISDWITAGALND